MLVTVRALLASVLVLATPAVAQQARPPAAADPDIVVTGDPDRDRQLNQFVRALTQSPETGQLARFEDPICPAAYGLSGPARDAVIARMRAVATAVGLRLGDARCTPNVLLMVTANKQALIRALARRNPAWFGDERDDDAYAVQQQAGRAAVWHGEEVVNADGRALSMVGGFAINRTTRPSGRVTAAARPAFIASAVVVEREALTGLSTTQLADYALMRALARTDPARLPPSAPETILRVIDAPMGSDLPVTLTRWDLGFLRGLYAGQPNLRTAAHRGEILRGVAAELARAEASGD